MKTSGVLVMPMSNTNQWEKERSKFQFFACPWKTVTISVQGPDGNWCDDGGKNQIFIRVVYCRRRTILKILVRYTRNGVASISV